jgi:glutamate dehydrogenase (NAD(P)+)
MNDDEKQTKPAPIIHEFIDDSVGLHAYIVIDSLCNNTSCGGLRISEDLSLEEIKVLAQAMTKKYCFLKQQMGGAKAGIILPKECSPEQRTKILETFGRNASVLLRKKTYIPWTDLNSSPEDIATLMNAAGCDFQGISDSSYFTALTVASAVKAACEIKAIDLSTISVIIEGFGEVGMNIAIELQNWGVTITGVSTIKGAIYDENGLDIKKVIELKKQYQDDFIQQYTNERLEHKGLLLEMDTDILIPCARTWCINKTNMKNIKAKIIIPAANAPLTTEAEEYLHQKGILCVPDFICNLGGVFGTSLYDNRNSIPKIHRFIMDEYGQLIKELILASQKKHCLPTEIARLIVEKNCKINNQRTQDNSSTKKASITLFNTIIHLLRFFPGLQPWITLQRQRKIFIENRKYMNNH